MRIIGEIPHKICKITVFKMELRFTVKFEVGMYEQAFRFRVSDELNSFEAVAKMIDEPFIEQVVSRFTQMRLDSEAMQNRFFVGGELEEVII